MKVSTKLSQRERHLREYTPKRRRNQYPSELDLLIRDVEHLVSCLEQGKLPTKEWCLSLANPPHPGYNKIDEKKRRWRYARE